MNQRSEVRDLIRDRLDAFLAEELPPVAEVSFGPDAKWALASGLQKAIRQGRTKVALTMATGLLEVDRRYIQRRLAIIAAEDAGHGNPMAVAATIWALHPARKAWRRGHDMARIVMALVHALCVGGKDRSACDAAVSAAWHPGHRRDWAEMARWTVGKLQQVMADSGQPVVRRALAAACLGGQRGGELVPRRPRKGALLEVADSLGIDPVSRWIVAAGLQMPLEGMAIQASWTSVEAAKQEPRFEADELLALPDLGPFPSATFDWHTSHGKRAVAYLLAACRPMRQMLLDGGVQPENLRECLGGLVFRAEGDLLDARLQSHVCLELRRSSIQSTVGYYGLDDAATARAIALLRLNAPMLHHARQRVLGLVPPGNSPPVFGLEDLG